MAHAQGVIVLLAAQHNIPVTYLTPLQIKQTVSGDGASDKKSVLKMLRLQMKEDLIVEDDDQSDAIACGLAYCYLHRNVIR